MLVAKAVVNVANVVYNRLYDIGLLKMRFLSLTNFNDINDQKTKLLITLMINVHYHSISKGIYLSFTKTKYLKQWDWPVDPL